MTGGGESAPELRLAKLIITWCKGCQEEIPVNVTFYMADHGSAGCYCLKCGQSLLDEFMGKRKAT